MSLGMIRGQAITVPNGATDSDPVIMRTSFMDADVIGFLSPDVLPETATIQISVDFEDLYAEKGMTLAAAIAAAHWDDVDAEASLGAAGAYAAVRTRYLVGMAFRIHLNGAAGGDRTFQTAKRVFYP